MEGLSNALLNHGPVKVFADNFEKSENYDQNSNLNIERIGQDLKFLENIEKLMLIRRLFKNNKVRAIFFDHWKSIENIDTNIFKKTKSFCLIHSKEINHPKGTSLNKRMLNCFIKESRLRYCKF